MIKCKIIVWMVAQWILFSWYLDEYMNEDGSLKQEFLETDADTICDRILSGHIPTQKCSTPG